MGKDKSGASDERKRRRARVDAIVDELDAEIRQFYADAATLERCKAALLRRFDEHRDRCDSWDPNDPCAGPLFVRVCLECGQSFLACDDVHGGARAAGHALRTHQRNDHGHTPEPLEQ